MLNVQGLTRCAMIDTGSNCSLLSNKFWEQLVKPQLQPYALKLSWENGYPLSIGGLCVLNVKLGAIKCQNPFIIANDMNVDILLRTRFFPKMM